MIVILYLLGILAANVLTAALAPFHFWGLIVPAGTLLIGATFILRDFVQQALGRGRTYVAIGVALLLSALTSFTLGDSLAIVMASAVTFALSETLDTEVFTRLRANLGRRVLISGAAGGTLDSIVFVIIGLSPLGAGFIPWAAVPLAILGQFIVKLGVQFIGVAIIKLLKDKTLTSWTIEIDSTP